jgi:hypothetical protein
MSTRKSTVCGFEGTGRTLAEAKKDSIAKARQYIDDTSNGPVVLKLDNLVCVIYRHREAWAYTMVCPELENGRIYSSSHMATGDTLQDTERRARLHAAQILMTDNDPALHVITNDEDKKEHLHYAELLRKATP